MRVWARKTDYYHPDKASQMTIIYTGKRQKRLKTHAKTEKTTMQREAWSLVTTAYNPHSGQSGCTSKPANAHILGYIMRMKHSDPIG